jgi:hypothetical protein
LYNGLLKAVLQHVINRFHPCVSVDFDDMRGGDGQYRLELSLTAPNQSGLNRALRDIGWLTLRNGATIERIEEEASMIVDRDEDGFQQQGCMKSGGDMASDSVNYESFQLGFPADCAISSNALSELGNIVQTANGAHSCLLDITKYAETAATSIPLPLIERAIVCDLAKQYHALIEDTYRPLVFPICILFRTGQPQSTTGVSWVPPTALSLKTSTANCNPLKELRVFLSTDIAYLSGSIMSKYPSIQHSYLTSCVLSTTAVTGTQESYSINRLKRDSSDLALPMRHSHSRMNSGVTNNDSIISNPSFTTVN